MVTASRFQLAGRALRWVACLFLSYACLSAAEDPKAKAKYLKELERVQKALILTPIKLDKTDLKAGDVVKPYSSLTNPTPNALIVPLPPGTPLDANQAPVGRADWFLRRKDGKPVSPMEATPAAKRAGRNHTLFLGSVSFAQLKPGEELEIPVHAIDVTKDNLASGEYEVVLNFVSHEFPFKVIATQTAGFTVTNANVLNALQLAQKSKENAALRASIARQAMSGLRLSEMTLSNTVVQKGATLTAECVLRNPTTKDIVVPDDLAKDALGEQWYLTKQPQANDYREPDGGNIVAMPQGSTFGAGKSMTFTRTIATNGLEPGTYEIAVEITDVSYAVIGLRKQKFRVVK